jgi:hypothetical protein
MVEAEEASPDELVWTLRLRPGLKFHDGEPVLAKDVVASQNRWAVRDSLGQIIKRPSTSLRRSTIAVPLGPKKGPSGKCYWRWARPRHSAVSSGSPTDAFRLISEHVGSGPLRFVENEWVPGARAVCSFGSCPRPGAGEVSGDPRRESRPSLRSMKFLENTMETRRMVTLGGIAGFWLGCSGQLAGRLR